MKQKRSVTLVGFGAVFCLLLSGCGKGEPSSEDRTGQIGVVTEACDIRFFYKPYVADKEFSWGILAERNQSSERMMHDTGFTELRIYKIF